MPCVEQDYLRVVLRVCIHLSRVFFSVFVLWNFDVCSLTTNVSASRNEYPPRPPPPPPARAPAPPSGDVERLSLL